MGEGVNWSVGRCFRSKINILDRAQSYKGQLLRFATRLRRCDNYQHWLLDSLPTDFQTLIYVNDELGDDMSGFFQEIEKVWELDMPLSRQHGDQIYLCKNPTPVFFERINTAIKQARNDVEIED